MKTWNVTAHRIPRNYNAPSTYLVEAHTKDDAIELVRRKLRDLADLPNYCYEATEYVERPIEGRIIG